MSDVKNSARRASESQGMAAFARIGLASRGFIYIVIGWLAIQIALGHSDNQANQRGAIAEVAQQPLGKLVLWLLGFGLAAYALWRLSEAAFGTAADGRKTTSRLKSLGRGIIYASFAVTTFLYIAGNPGKSTSQKQQSTTAKLLHHSYGQWLVAIAGLVIIGFGAGMIVTGAKKKFTKNLQMHRLTGTTRDAVVRLGMVGYIARGVVFVIIGILVIDAAVTYDPKKSSGLDGALRTLAHQSWGAVLLWFLALGLVAFGVYGFATAKWGKVRPDNEQSTSTQSRRPVMR